MKIFSSRPLKLLASRLQALLGRALPGLRRTAGQNLQEAALRGGDGGAAGAGRRKLVVDRPATLEQRYGVLEHDGLADEVFRRLQRGLYAALDGSPSAATRGVGVRRGPVGRSVVFREAGRLGVAPTADVASADGRAGRAYFYLKCPNRPGWLFERSGSGWVLSEAEKIVARDLFLRRGAALDVVSLYLAKDYAAFPRVRSPLFGGDLLAFGVYEQKLLQSLDLR